MTSNASPITRPRAPIQTARIAMKAANIECRLPVINGSSRSRTVNE